jgi:hypothetical protein
MTKQPFVVEQVQKRIKNPLAPSAAVKQTIVLALALAVGVAF